MTFDPLLASLISLIDLSRPEYFENHKESKIGVLTNGLSTIQNAGNKKDSFLYLLMTGMVFLSWLNYQATGLFQGYILPK